MQGRNELIWAYMRCFLAGTLAQTFLDDLEMPEGAYQMVRLCTFWTETGTAFFALRHP